MNAQTVARRVAAPIGRIGEKFMVDQVAFGRSAETGLCAGPAPCAQGRIGELGDVAVAYVEAN